ncbi:MAG: hypothetical protein WBV55_23910, partial [Candidatus Sulfotelmatobacter sp.]
VITKLPGILDLIIHEHQALVALAQAVAANHAANAQGLAKLESTLSEQNTAHNSAIAEQSASLSNTIAQQREQMQTILDAHQLELDVMNTRLAMLQRSLWRKIREWWIARWRRRRRSVKV